MILQQNMRKKTIYAFYSKSVQAIIGISYFLAQLYIVFKLLGFADSKMIKPNTLHKSCKQNIP